MATESVPGRWLNVITKGRKTQSDQWKKCLGSVNKNARILVEIAQRPTIQTAPSLATNTTVFGRYVQIENQLQEASAYR